MKFQLLLVSMVTCFATGQCAHAQSWLLTGNAGTTPGTNFVGTTDAKPLMFKVNNQKSGYIDYLLSKGANTGFGYQTLLNISGSNGGNAAFGFQSLYTNTTGAYNTGTGEFSLYSNTTGSSNTASGVRALYSNTTGGFNTAFGNRAAYSNTNGNSNTSAGNFALYKDISGSYNVAIGDSALYNTKGSASTAVGYHALASQTGSSGFNTAVGTEALSSTTSGNGNSALGYHALYNNTTGTQNTAIGELAMVNINGVANTAVGNYAIGLLTAGNDNSAMGRFAMAYAQGTCYSITAMGSNALAYLSSNDDNTAIGAASLGNLNGVGDQNTAVGSYSGNFLDHTMSNTISIGYYASAGSSNQARIGNSSITSIGGQVGWTAFSDGRFKKNIKENVPGLSFINLLKPITYTFDISGLQQYKGEAAGAKQKPNNTEQEKIVHTGFIAQEVEAIAKRLNYDFDGVDAPQNSKGLYGLRYEEFVVPLVKSVQELSRLNDEKDAKINDLETRLSKIEALLNAQQATGTSHSQQTIGVSSANLEQNKPNPFSSVTTLNYMLPDHYTSAKIVICDNSGKVLQEKNITGSKTSSLQIDAATLSAGVYQYSLYVNDKLIGSKQMVVAK